MLSWISAHWIRNIEEEYLNFYFRTNQAEISTLFLLQNFFCHNLYSTFISHKVCISVLVCARCALFVSFRTGPVIYYYKLYYIQNNLFISAKNKKVNIWWNESFFFLVFYHLVFCTGPYIHTYPSRHTHFSLPSLPLIHTDSIHFVKRYQILNPIFIAYARKDICIICCFLAPILEKKKRKKKISKCE
jgi:hypothetical protein